MMDVLKDEIPMDICQMLRLFVMEKYQNKALILELQELPYKEDKDGPPRKKRKLS